MQSEPLLGGRPTAASLLNWRPPLRLRAKSAWKKLKTLIPIWTSFGIGLRVRKGAQAASFLADPLLKARTVFKFWQTADYWWGSLVLACAILPLFLMYVAMNATFRPELKKKRNDAFENAHGGSPSVCTILRIHAKMLWKIFEDGCMAKETLTHKEATYAKLMLVLGVAEQFCFTFLSAYIFVRQYFLTDHVIVTTPSAMLPATASALLNVYMAFDFFATYSSICTGGDKSAYWDILVSFGEGAAPPSVLIKIRTEQTVSAVGDIGNLDTGGVKSIFKAVGSSTPLAHLTLSGTWFNEYYANHPNREFAGQEIRNGFIAVCANRGSLRTIQFDPPLQVPARCFTFASAVQLQQIRNGAEVIYSRDNKVQDTPLRRSLDVNDFHGVADLVSGGYSPEFYHYDPVISLDFWQSLRVLLAHCPPSDPILKQLFVNACGENSLMVVELLLFWATPATLANATVGTWSALISACDRGRTESVKRLLEAKADACMPGPDGQLPIHSACNARCDSSYIVQCLLDARTSPTACNPAWYNFTPLHYVAVHNHPTTTKLLLEAGAARDVFSGTGTQPLFEAAGSGSVEALRALLLARADPSTLQQGEFEGQTPLSLARLRGNALCVEVLEACSI